MSFTTRCAFAYLIFSENTFSIRFGIQKAFYINILNIKQIKIDDINSNFNSIFTYVYSYNFAVSCRQL